MSNVEHFNSKPKGTGEADILYVDSQSKSSLLLATLWLSTEGADDALSEVALFPWLDSAVEEGPVADPPESGGMGNSTPGLF